MPTATTIQEVYNDDDKNNVYYRRRDIFGRLFGQKFKQGSRIHKRLIREGIAPRLPSQNFTRRELNAVADKYGISYKNVVQYINRNNIRNITDLKSRIMTNTDRRIDIIKNKLGNYNGKFKITFVDPNSEFKRDYPFSHLNHYLNWEKQLNTQNTTSDSSDVNYKSLVIKDIVLVDKQRGGQKTKEQTITFDTDYFRVTLFTPESSHNNCLFAVIKYVINIPLIYEDCKQQLGLKKNEKVPIEKAKDFINNMKLNNIEIIDVTTFDNIPNEDKIYIGFYKDHYYYVEKIGPRSQKNKNNKSYCRGSIFFDCETREVEKSWLCGNTTVHALKDTICHCYIKSSNGEQSPSKYFETDSETGVSSMRKLLDFLKEKHAEGRSYTLYAHNGSRFDFFFILNVMTPSELMNAKCVFRGTSVIKFNYLNNVFKDTYCYLTSSLANLSKSFHIDHKKLQSFIVDGKTLTNTQMCFYKPELSFNQFMQLKYTDVEFWKLYNEYCQYDCISLCEIWNKFSTCITQLEKNIKPCLLQNASLHSTCTIGSHSLKILKTLNKKSKVFKCANQFIDNNLEKYRFIELFKTGGISHCHKPGKYLNGISSIDVNSMYPASMIHMNIPCGESRFIEGGDQDTFNQNLHGFYHLCDLVFDTDYSLKPICVREKGKSLQWNTDKIVKEAYCSTYMIKYLINKYGLKKFKIVKALVSENCVKGEEIFGDYINNFYKEKQRQDELKKADNDKYNPALRESIKLYLNSLSGKLIEDTTSYTNKSVGYIYNKQASKHLGGIPCYIEDDNLVNNLLVSGVCIYEYSKIMLFEYIDCMPGHDIIHTETDSLYFESKYLDTVINNINNYKGELSEISYGNNELGGVKLEHNSKPGEIAYFIGKKIYMIKENGEYTFRCKGVPIKTFDADGTEKQIITESFYENLYNGVPQTISFKSMKRKLFGKEIDVGGYEMTRTINPPEIFINKTINTLD